MGKVNEPGQGRPRKPTKLRMLHNAQMKKVPDTEPQPECGVPKAPYYLTPAAKIIWKKFGPMLDKVGLMTPVDEPTFALFCTSYAELQKVEKAVKKAGHVITNPISGNEYVNPLAYVLYKLRTQVAKYSAKFGMSPQDRSGISIPTRDEANPYRTWQQSRGSSGFKEHKTS